ncbi:unnamed protein product [Nezara viridula]|uniref:Uncharacterized protein n=1 Tax=Nezara viridula TaxID=85310 RepID=A0A9P0H5Z1_NEZVI|nr:unnamed protein product [Nezara viridula]
MRGIHTVVCVIFNSPPALRTLPDGLSSKYCNIVAFLSSFHKGAKISSECGIIAKVPVSLRL